MKKTDKSPVRILKIATCPSLSGKSTLTYHVGCMAEADIRFRVFANSGGGFYSNEWVAASDIQRALAKTELVTATSLQPIFKGKSANSAGFLLAVLKREGLIGRSTKNTRCYVRTESEAFVAEIKELMQAGVDLDPDAKPGSVKKTAAKKAGATPARKTSK